MSNLRKYLKRKTYKERHQPISRREFGLLEKHKDYVERAKVHHEQEAKLEKLQREAEERNVNEFYFSMEHERTKSGIPIQMHKKLPVEEELLMKSKDLNFVNLRIQQETKEVARLKASLHLLGNKSSNSHIVFVDTEQEAEKFKDADFFQTPKDLLERSYNRPRRRQMKSSQAPSEDLPTDGRQTADLENDLERRYEELNRRMETLESLKSLANELWLRKQVMKGEDRKKLVQEDGSVFIKWKKIRKR